MRYWRQLLDWWSKPEQLAFSLSDCHCKNPVKRLCSEEYKHYCDVCLEWL